MLVNPAAVHDLPFLEILKIFWFSLLFNGVTLTYLNLPFILFHLLPLPQRETRWYQLSLKLYFLIAQGVILLSNLADSYYFRFSGKRTGTEFLQLQQDFTSMFRTYVADYGFLVAYCSCSALGTLIFI